MLTLYLLIAKWSLIVYGAIAAIWLIWKFACKAADFLSADEDPEKKKLAAQVDVLRERVRDERAKYLREITQLLDQHHDDLKAEKAKNEVFRALNPQQAMGQTLADWQMEQQRNAMRNPTPGIFGNLGTLLGGQKL